MEQIHKLLAQIPEESADEAIASIQSIRIEPPRKARLTCHLSKKFFILLEVKKSGEILINDCSATGDFLAALKRIIYEQDEAAQPYVVLKERVTYRPAPPKDMDLPTWNEATQSWYDAEY